MLEQQSVVNSLANNDMLRAQNANCVVMVPPKEFAFNAQTAKDNEFQHVIQAETERDSPQGDGGV